MLKIAVILIVFLLGVYFCLYFEQAVLNETFENMVNTGYTCPNVLIKTGKELLLKNTKLAEIPGVNPLRFNDLEEYVEFTEWQRSQGIKCPVLFLQNTYDVQGNNVYKMRPYINDLNGGLPPSVLDETKHNAKLYTTPLEAFANNEYDENGQNYEEEPLDKMY